MITSKIILTADWHLREDMPVCRNDSDWMGVQRSAMEFLIDFANRKGAAVAIVGDLFHRSHVHPSVVSMFLDVVGKYAVSDGGVFLLAGQHDLPFHSLENMSKSSFGNLWLISQQRKTMLRPMSDLGVSFNFGEFQAGEVGERLGLMVFLHQLCFKSKEEMPPTKEAVLAEDLAVAFPKAKYICLGDNHHQFLWERDSRWVINPGCLVRQSADLIDYEPGFYYLDAGRHELGFVNVPDSGSVSNAHIVKEKERDDRIEAFISTLEKGKEVSLDFIQNLRSRMGELEKPVVAVLETMLEEIGGTK